MPDLNQDVISFAKKNKGSVVKATGKKKTTDKAETTIGDGTCWDLPYEALKTAGAKMPNIYGGDLYDWGQLIPIGSARTGDIIQFKNHIATVTIVTKTGHLTTTETKTYKRGPIHSAIVADVNSDGTMVVLEQHLAGAPGVRQNKVYFQSHAATTSGNITTTVKVSGSFKFYRPVSKDSKE